MFYQEPMDVDRYPILRISSINRQMGQVVGGEMMKVMSVDVEPGDDIVAFFYRLDGQGTSWRRLAEFVDINTVNQGIFFRVPGYITMDVDREVSVYFEIIRPSDQARSNPIEYKFIPIQDLPKNYSLDSPYYEN